MSICVLGDNGYCERHKKVHKGVSLKLCLENSEKGETHRQLQDYILLRKSSVGIRDMSKPRKRVLGTAIPVASTGPGTELKGLLSKIGVVSTLACGCDKKMKIMNEWGVVKCRENIDEIVGWMREGYKKWGWKDILGAAARAVASGLAFKLNVLDPFPSLVEEAIRLAEEKETSTKATQSTLTVNESNITRTSTIIDGKEIEVNILEPVVTKEIPAVKSNSIKWVVGITTVPSRRDNLLAHTLLSLRQGGFNEIRLFVDGDRDGDWYISQGWEYPLTLRHPKIGVFGNWFLGLIELYIRNPDADRYVMFQDDVVTYKSLRQYLEQLPYPDEKGYCNLYTFPRNQTIAPKNDKGGTIDGWFLSNQLGLGAVALMFNRDAVVSLISHKHIIQRPESPSSEWKTASVKSASLLDGAIVTALTKAGFKEYCHSPSLVQHMGDVSTIGDVKHPKAESFRGEEFNALELLKR